MDRIGERFALKPELLHRLDRGVDLRIKVFLGCHPLLDQLCGVHMPKPVRPNLVVPPGQLAERFNLLWSHGIELAHKECRLDARILEKL